MSDLPRGWIGQKFALLNSFRSASIDPARSPNETFELYSVPSFPTRKPELVRGAEIGSTKQLVSAGDVLICKINPRINRVWSVAETGAVRQIASSEWIGFRAPEQCTGFYRYYYSSPAFREQLCTDLTGVGGSLTRAQPKRVDDFIVPVAPLGEQQRIADKLETVLARVDACRDRLTRIAPLLKRFRQSILAAATSGRLTGDWRDAPAHDTAPPTGWTRSSIREVTTDIRYGTSKKCAYGNEGVGVLRIPNIRADGSIDASDLKRGDFSVNEVEALSLQVGDLLVIRSNGSVDLVGRTAVVSKAHAGMLFAGYLIRLRVSADKVLPNFLYLCLTEPRQRATIESTAKSTSGVNNINSEELLGLCLHLPPVAEQAEIVRRVDTLFAFADRLEARLSQAKTAVDRLPPSLLAKAFRGELVPQDPEDEPAAELLKRLAGQRAAAPVKGRKARQGQPA